ncbi:MAG TPA: hypothetical protein VEL77_15180 [Rugosimonospora sp.]|nr:hypothetical protein [Rugosimonospora sp.]
MATPLPRYFPSLEQAGISPELRTGIRNAFQKIYDLRDQLAMTFVDAETPRGLVDGTNKIFQLAFAPNPPASLQLFLGGLLLLQGIDYTLTGPDIVYTTAPALATWHRAWYRKT